MSVSISACIITLNEEDKIEACLKSLSFTDEIIIVDSGSTDKTLEIAEKYRARVYIREFDNYVNQKNYCLSLAKNDWILSLDADEVVPIALKKEILSMSSAFLEEYDGFSVPRLTYYLGKWIYHGGWYPNRQVRLFRKTRGKFSGLLVHEKVLLDGKTGSLQRPLHHYSYKNISDHLKYIDRYSSLAAKEKFESGKSSGVILSISKALWKFFHM